MRHENRSAHHACQACLSRTSASTFSGLLGRAPRCPRQIHAPQHEALCETDTVSTLGRMPIGTMSPSESEEDEYETFSCGAASELWAPCNGQANQRWTSTMAPTGIGPAPDSRIRPRRGRTALGPCARSGAVPAQEPGRDDPTAPARLRCRRSPSNRVTKHRWRSATQRLAPRPRDPAAEIPDGASPPGLAYRALMPVQSLSPLIPPRAHRPSSHGYLFSPHSPANMPEKLPRPGDHLE